MALINIDGDVTERLVYGKSLCDLSNRSWVEAGCLNISDVYGFDVYGIRERVNAFSKVRDMALMLILLGYGETPQEVLDWFIHPYYGEWVKGDVPYMVRWEGTGSSRLEVGQISCSVDGVVSFVIDILGEEVDLNMSWDRFLLSATIDVRGDYFEGI